MHVVSRRTRGAWWHNASALPWLQDIGCASERATQVNVSGRHKGADGNFSIRGAQPRDRPLAPLAGSCEVGPVWPPRQTGRFRLDAPRFSRERASRHWTQYRNDHWGRAKRWPRKRAKRFSAPPISYPAGLFQGPGVCTPGAAIARAAQGSRAGRSTYKWARIHRSSLLMIAVGWERDAARILDPKAIVGLAKGFSARPRGYRSVRPECAIAPQAADIPLRVPHLPRGRRSLQAQWPWPGTRLWSFTVPNEARSIRRPTGRCASPREANRRSAQSTQR